MIDEIRRANAHRAIIDLGDDNPEIVAALRHIRDGGERFDIEAAFRRMERHAIANDWHAARVDSFAIACHRVADMIADGKYGVVAWLDGDGDRLTSIRTVVNR